MTSPFDALLEELHENKPHVAKLTLTDSSGKYRIGEPSPPLIPHDGGHLAKFGKREPTAADHAALVAGITLLEGSEALNNAQTGGITTFGDMADANAAYRHFLFGKGAKRQINYERYLEGDPSGLIALNNIIKDFQTNIEVIGQHREKFSVTSELFTIGNAPGAIGPYPETENWQKAIGAHFIWVSANVNARVVNKKIHYHALITVHMEDKYNFNPGDKDIGTGIPDSLNGRLETSGLALQYLNYATLIREVEWPKGDKGNTIIKGKSNDRHRKPSDNRRLRNKV